MLDLCQLQAPYPEQRHGRAALKAARSYYRHDDTGSFSPRVWLLGAAQNVVHELSAE